MQYDVQRGGPTTSEQGKSARTKPALSFGARFGRGGNRSPAPAQATGAPPLRDRLREVLERDRALAEAHRPSEAPHEVPALSREPAPRELEPKSGTHVRVPQGDAPARSRPRASFESEPTSSFFESEPASSLIASWIEEEITEAQPVSAAPVVLERPVQREPKPARTPGSSGASPDDELDRLLQELAELEPEAQTPAPLQAAPVPRSVPIVSTNEPIATRTMARLLATHGYNVRALSIYDHLISRQPDDEELRAEAELLRG